MNCLFITAGGRKVRAFRTGRWLRLEKSSPPIPPNPPSPFADYQSISDVVLFRLRLKHLTLLLLHLGNSLKTAGLIHDFRSNLLLLFLECLGLCWLISVLYCYSLKHVSLTTYVTEGGSSFFHFPPAGSTNKRVGKVCRLSYPISKESTDPQ